MINVFGFSDHPASRELKNPTRYSRGLNTDHAFFVLVVKWSYYTGISYAWERIAGKSRYNIR